jgi:hypothetical protein
MRRLSSLLWAALGTVLLGLGALPGARIPIIGDDLQAFFESYDFSDGSAARAFGWGWGQGLKAGHFNPVGQGLGGLYHYGAYAFTTALETSPQVYDVGVGLVLLGLAVLGAAMVVTWGLRQVGDGVPVSFWRTYALVAAITGATIQLHPWSNDPVTSFGPAGWGSAAIGFGLLGLALRATMPGRTSRRALVTDAVLITLLGVFAVTYYEMLVGMIAGTAVVYLLAFVRARLRHDAQASWRAVLLGGLGVVLPAVVFVAGRMLAVPAQESNYTGTALSLGPDALATWWAAMVGALPAGGWLYLVPMSGGAPLTVRSLAYAAAMCLGVALLVLVWRRVPIAATRWTRSSALLLGGVLATWALTTATHATSQKYIDEIKVPGQVYLYYGVGVICVAMLLAWAVHVLAPRLPRGVGPAALVLVGAFLAVQMPLNWHLSDVSAVAFAPNRVFAGAASTDDLPAADRCAAMLTWAERPWPEYYRDAIVQNSQESFALRFGTPLCPDAEVLEQIAAID